METPFSTKPSSGFNSERSWNLAGTIESQSGYESHEVDIDSGFHSRALTRYNALSGNRSPGQPLRASNLALRSSRLSCLASNDRNSILLLRRLSVGVGSIGSGSTTRSFTTNIMKQSENTFAGQGDEELFGQLEGDFSHAVEFLRNDIVGRNRLLEGPFGPRVKVYLDYTAAGQGLMSINKYMAWLKEHFANTHTEDSATGRFMTSAFDDALKSIETCVNAKGKFMAICTGTGTTGALLRLQQILGIYIPPSAWKQLELLTCKGLNVDSKERISLSAIPNPSIKDEKTLPFSGECPVWWRARDRVKSVIRSQGRLPLVFVGGYEHHSNELSWRYGLCDTIRIGTTKGFELDLEELENQLQHHRNKSPNRPIIGAFSACSNVTGMRTDLNAVSKLLRAVNAKFFVDFAASGPYQDIDCNPENNPDLFDGFVLSPHKFLGGDGSCGLLMLRKSIYDSRLPPTFCGGGTVKFVGQSYHAFSDDIVERENAGTPGALQIYQTALAFEVKELVGPFSIEAREAELLEDFFAWVKDNYSREICILGNPDPKLRHSIVSFNIVAPQPLHPRFVTVLLSDLFGVQTRAGCSCAGPHGLDILGSNPKMEKLFFSLMVGDSRGYKIEDEPDSPNMFSLKPGWARLNLHYTMDADEMWYLKEVLSFTVAHGARFLSVYSFDVCTGSWEFKPPDSMMKAISPASKDGEHHFGLQAAYGCQHSRRLIDTLQKAGSRRQLLEAQLRDANKLLKYLPEFVKYGPPPAPFPEINLPALGPQPFFVVAEGQVHNVENMERKMKEWESGKKTPVPQPQQKQFKQIVDPILEVEASSEYFLQDSGRAEAITLSWSALSFAVKVRNGKKEILRSCSGVAKSGQVLCILGPSGAGKTTLLDALSDRIRPGRNRILEGEILVNGYPRDSSFRFLRSHVPQFHNLFWMFTVRETLWQAAHLVMHWSTPMASKHDKIQSVMIALGLESCADTKVGLPFVFRGLSGGQLKRLSIAVELLSDPSLLICDEPTSSLDSKAAEQVMLYLSKIARTKNITVISTIHQPSTKIWQAIDYVCLMTGGRTAYFGPRAEAVAFFLSHGLACPQYSNPADFFLDVLNMDFSNGMDTEQLEPVFKACKKGLSAELESLDFVAADQVGAKYCANNGIIQFAILLRRFFLKNLKDPGIFWVRAVMYTALSVLVALQFHGLGDKRHEESINSRLALNFYVAAFFVFMAIAAAPQLIEDRGVFVRERVNGYYGTLPYCLANYLAILPGLLAITLITGAIIIPTTHLMAFDEYVFMMFPALAVAEGIVNAFSSIAPHYIVSSALIAGLNGGFMLVQGFMQVKSDIPDYLLWMHHSAYHTYVFRMAMSATFKDLDTVGAGVLKMYDMDDADETTDFIVLICYAFGLQVVFFLVMSWLHDGRH